MKGKILTGAGLLLIAAALLLTVYNIRESDRAGQEDLARYLELPEETEEVSAP